MDLLGDWSFCGFDGWSFRGFNGVLDFFLPFFFLSMHWRDEDRGLAGWLLDVQD